MWPLNPIYSFLAGVVLMLALSVTAHNLRVDALQAKWHDETAAKVEAAEQAVIKQCNDDKAKSQKAQAGYEARIGSINTKYDRLQQYAGRCVSLSSDTTPIPASGSQPSGTSGFTVDFIRRIARDGDIYRAQRITDDEYLGR